MAELVPDAWGLHTFERCHDFDGEIHTYSNVLTLWVFIGKAA